MRRGRGEFAARSPKSSAWGICELHTAKPRDQWRQWSRDKSYVLAVVVVKWKAETRTLPATPTHQPRARPSSTPCPPWPTTAEPQGNWHNQYWEEYHYRYHIQAGAKDRWSWVEYLLFQREKDIIPLRDLRGLDVTYYINRDLYLGSSFLKKADYTPRQRNSPLNIMDKQSDKAVQK